MPTCNICNEIYATSKALITHLKIVHGCHNESIFQCAELNCNRLFSSLNSFRKHLKTHVVLCDTNEFKEKLESSVDWSRSTNLKQVLPENFESNHFKEPSHDYCSSENSRDYNKSETTQSETTRDTLNFDFLKFKDTIIVNNVKTFISKLYADSTMCRKDVQNITEGVQNLLFYIFDELKFNENNKYV